MLRRAVAAALTSVSLLACSEPQPSLPPSAAPVGTDAPVASATETALAAVTSASSALNADPVAALSGSAPPPDAATASSRALSAAELERRKQLELELSKLDAKMFETLNQPGVQKNILQDAPSPGLLDEAARSGAGVARGSSGSLQQGAGGGGSLRPGAGGGGLAEIGGSSAPAASIGGKAPGEAKADDVAKAIALSGCSATRKAGTAPLVQFDVTCDAKKYLVSFVPKGIQVEPKQLTELQKDAAVFNEFGIWLVVRPEVAADLASARSLLKKLHGDTRNSEPRGSVTVSGATVTGGAVSNAASVVAGMAAGFRRCYNRGLKEDPISKGSLRLTIDVGPNGEVTGATTSGGDGLSATVLSCIRARASSAQFAPPDGPGSKIVVPLSFFSE